MTLLTTAALTLADVVTTAAGQSTGIVEGNPISAAVIGQSDLASWAILKLWLLSALVIAAALWQLPPWVRFVIQLVNVVMAFVVLSNVGLVIRG